MDLAIANVYETENWSIGSICYRCGVSSNLLSVHNFVLTIHSACVVSILRIYYSVENLKGVNSAYTLSQVAICT